jgi:uncharacterized protein
MSDMIVDSHAHVMFPPERQIRMMNEAGIDKTILFSTSIHPEAAKDIVSFEKEMNILNEIISGKYNPERSRALALEEQCRVIREYPSRFLGFGIVPTGLSKDETRSWIEEKVVDNKFYGIGEIAVAPGQTRMLDNIFNIAAEMGGMPLWIHTFSPLGLEDITGIDALSRRYPSVPVILGHLGGINWMETIRLAKKNTSLFLDLSGTYTIFAPTLAIKEIPERTVFSSDAPYGEPLLIRTMIERITEDSHVRERVLGGTIAELLGL